MRLFLDKDGSDLESERVRKRFYILEKDTKRSPHVTCVRKVSLIKPFVEFQPKKGNKKAHFGERENIQCRFVC